MACDITFRVVAPASSATRCVAAGRKVFEEVERACTRFDPTSPLMRANADPESWHDVPEVLASAVREARLAHEETGGLFDPRVLKTLESWGYDRSLPFASGEVATARTAAGDSAYPYAPWNPGVRDSSVLLGPEPIDLGGIGKGLAVRWAASELASAGSAVLVEAGGDCSLLGAGPEGDGWRIGVENPSGGSEPVAVLSLVDRSVATSSIRLRRWRAGGEQVHHIVDPRTGRPGGPGLLAVTVVADDPARAEVWSKSLFLSGLEGIGPLAERQGLAALWVAEDGELATSAPMDEFVIWRSDRG
jgi:thiamine biosynthesis lipoprotein